MKTAIKTLIFISLLVIALGLDLTWDRTPKMTFIKNAQAIIGMPFTPMSYAGVARRTTRRFVYADTAVAASTAAAASASAYAAQEQAAAAQQQAAAAKTASSGVPVGTVVQSLPAGCESVTVSGHEYSDCHGSFYKAAFQGNNLVYVVVPNPM
jgi:hypothetical protein